MRVGMIAEGSYPYVSGGVSSWIHTLITGMEDIEFSLFTITPEKKKESELKYTLTKNTVHHQNIELITDLPVNRVKSNLTKEELSLLFRWFTFQTLDPQALLILGNREKMGSVDEFFESESFYTLVQECYEFEELYGSFLDYMWMWKSMYTPIMHLLQQDYSKVDVIHTASTGYGGLIGTYISIVQNIPFIITEHGIYSREREEEILQSSWIPVIYKKRWIQLFHHLSKIAYEQAEDIITLFEKNRGYQLELGASPEKTAIVPNGIDINTALTLQGKKPVFHIGAIVRIVPIKDIKTMIYAANTLRRWGYDFHWSILGSDEELPEYAQECKDLVVSLELEQWVTFTGKVNVQDYLLSFDVCVLTSLSEGQPLAILEGMAAARPWVATDVGSCRELIEGREEDPYGACGFVIPPIQPEELADRLRWFINHPELLGRMGQNGLNRVKNDYLLSDVITFYRNLYAERGEKVGRHRIPAAKII
ncbi:GT4 family glycosyltransferase PelF [Metabacillus sp. KIGAM252]|uniref:GT4 family glycosyltransferase PelF n=1 Tax=Metabacillus flavus TaxID=2823519 RepID=A0ABS5LH14_9BACI|nr:GT4 family glycosyltransferase PelF [Metabacillus flavus]MBS2970035.1 GT4 family glycosyltransferase PelF [Metabacillus flavus]